MEARLRRALWTAALVVAILAVCAGTWFYLTDLTVRPPWHSAFDLRVYRGAVRWWLDGRPLYDFLRPGTTKGFTYPPFAILCLLPLVLGTETTATILITVVSGVLVVLTTWQLVVPLARRHGWVPWAAVGFAIPLVVAMEPVREALGWGQIDLVIAALVLADGPALRRGRPWAGVGIGLAAAIKITPALFVVYLVATRRWRAAAVAAGTAGAATVLGLVADPSASVQFWLRTLWQTSRVGPPTDPNNQSLLGLLARLAAPAPPTTLLWVALAGTVLVMGIGRAAVLFRRGDDLGGFVITGLTAGLVSPISWVHHLYWVVPAAVVLVDLAGGTPVGGGAPWRPRWDRAFAAGGALVVVGTFVSSVVWYVVVATGSSRPGPLGAVGENAYVLIMAALVLLLPARREQRVGGTARPCTPVPGPRFSRLSGGPDEAGHPASGQQEDP